MPYGENFSLYQTPAHQAFRLEVRRIIHELLLPMVEEDNGRPVTKETLLKLGETGILACFMGPGEHLNMVPTLPGGLHPEEFDEFHETICQEEIALIGSLGMLMRAFPYTATDGMIRCGHFLFVHCIIV